jgi:hypothetical protein
MKPTVEYTGKGHLVYSGLDNEGNEVYTASLLGINHPILGTTMIRTSRVIANDVETGTIETLNTMYVPKENDNEVGTD